MAIATKLEKKIFISYDMLNPWDQIFGRTATLEMNGLFHGHQNNFI